jgi:hypothetical protein
LRTGGCYHEYGLGTDSPEVQFSHLPGEPESCQAAHAVHSYFTRYHKRHLPADRRPTTTGSTTPCATGYLQELNTFLHNADSGVDQWLRGAGPEDAPCLPPLRPADRRFQHVILDGGGRGWNDFFQQGPSTARSFTCSTTQQNRSRWPNRRLSTKLLGCFQVDKAFEEGGGIRTNSLLS